MHIEITEEEGISLTVYNYTEDKHLQNIILKAIKQKGVQLAPVSKILILSGVVPADNAPILGGYATKIAVSEKVHVLFLPHTNSSPIWHWLGGYALESDQKTYLDVPSNHFWLFLLNRQSNQGFSCGMQANGSIEKELKYKP